MIYNANLLECSFPQEITGDGLHKIGIVANAGSRMQFEDTAIVLDMANLKTKFHAGALPILYNHNWQEPIGHAAAISNDGDKMSIDATVSIENDRANQVTASLKNGFPWQASLGFSVLDGHRIKKGETEIVNGRAETDCIVATSIELWECSVVLYGADNATSCNLTASLKEEEVEEEVTSEEIINCEEQKPVEENKIDEIAKMREAMAIEQERVDAIRELGNKYNASTAEAIRSGVSANEFELKLLREAHSNPAPAVHATNDNTALDSKVLEVAVLRTAGINVDNKYDEKVLEAADRHRNDDFRELVEAITGYQPTYAQRKDGSEWLAGVSNYSLDTLMVTTTNAVLEKTWYEQDLSWQQWCKITTTPDFKTYDRYRITSDFKFKKVDPAGEFEHGALNDYKLPGIIPETYGRQQAITWQDIVNGNTLNVWGDIMTRFAWGCNQAIQEVVYTGWLANNPDSGGNNFFSAAHNNLLTSKPLTVDNLSAATTAFVLRDRGMGGLDKDEPLGLEPQVLLIPYSLRYTADMITKAALFQANAGSPMDYNPHRGAGWKVIYTRCLEDARYGGGYSSTSWYLMANPSLCPTGEVVFLNGQQTPTIRQADMEIGRLGIRFDGHVSFGYGIGDYRGAIKCTA